MSQTAAFQEAKSRLESFAHIEGIQHVVESPAWDDLDEVEAEILRDKLMPFLLKENNKKLRKLYDTVFATLIMLAKYYPVNAIYNREGIPATAYCIIERKRIVNPIYTASGLQLEAATAREVSKHLKLLKRDGFYMYLQSKKANVPVASHMYDVNDKRMSMWVRSYFILNVFLFTVAALIMAPYVAGILLVAALAASTVAAIIGATIFTRTFWKREFRSQEKAIENSLETLMTLAEQEDEVIQPAPELPEVVALNEEFVEDQPGLLLADVEPFLAEPEGEADVIAQPEESEQETDEIDNVIIGEPDHADSEEGIPNPAGIYVAGRPRLLSWMNNAAPVAAAAQDEAYSPALRA
jgi:hypothetical protein